MNKKIEGVRMHVRVTASQHEILKRVAAKGGYSVSETLRRAIDSYIATVYRRP